MYQRDNQQCYKPECQEDAFGIAKKRHADNLRHQVLPDRVDDSIFKNPAKFLSCNCQSRLEAVESRLKRKDQKVPFSLVPALGCKEPKTKMDLAICWETPVNPLYEPIADSTENDTGVAPAIFSLVKETTSSAKLVPRSGKYEREADETCCSKIKCENANGDIFENDQACSCNCNCLTKHFKSMEISGKNEKAVRRCVACGNGRKNTLTKYNVTRPRTPFAKRKFSINSLSPPFSITNGCRDTDYPEHWRLMSIYQQSYRNPRKLRYALRR
ncbi:uncharacterized protein [Prorops nasuta]|uniref:uncharacterized protein isoform X2 n=1 Tax=Prorops nasuta TaxID=863751 RepID=UPI0034CF4B49